MKIYDEGYYSSAHGDLDNIERVFMFAAGIVCTGIVLPLAVIADVVTARGYIVGVEEGFTAHAVGWTCSAFESFRTGRAKTYTLG